jgi:hypothetical protein
MITILDGDYENDGEYAISSGVLERQKNKNMDMTYDIIIEVPKDHYYFDIETRVDFLTTSIDFALFATD